MNDSKDFIILEPVDLPEMVNRNYVTSKPAIAKKAGEFVGAVLEKGNPLAVVENLSAIKEFIDLVRKDERLTNYVVDMLSLNQGKVKLSSGTKVERMEAGVEYEYGACRDAVLRRLLEQEEAAKEAVKARKEFLRKVPEKGLTVVDEETGEVMQLFPPTRHSTTTYKVVLSAKDMTLIDDGTDLPF